jgi:hypothetical protein
MVTRKPLNEVSGRPTLDPTEITMADSKFASANQTGFMPLSKSTRQIPNNSMSMF